MVLISFTLLIAKPVHEKSIWKVYHKYCHSHIAGNTEGCYPCQKSGKKPQRSEKLRHYSQKCEDDRYPHLFCKKSQSSGKTKNAKTPKNFLYPMREKNN